MSNQRLTALSAQGGSAAGPVAIDIGGCEVDCSGQTRLLSAGSINVVTDGALNIGDAVSYGTRQLGLGMSALNLGSAEAIATAAAAGLPAGMTMNQEVLQRLLRGNTATATGAPALEALSLTARDAINVFGSVDLDTRDSATGRSSLRSLVLGAPAIHGYGSATDRARIFADTLVWDGTLAGTALAGGEQTQPAGEAMVGRRPRAAGDQYAGAGAGACALHPVQLDGGRRSPGARLRRRNAGGVGSHAVLRQRQPGRLPAPGRLRGRQRLAVEWRRAGYRHPLLTGNAGAQLAIRNGGTVQLRGAAATTGSDALGAELSITAERIGIDSRVALASGRFEANARQGMTLGSNGA